MIVSSCPTRVSFSSCDHAPFDAAWGGAAINACINKRVYIIIRKRNRLENFKYRISYSKTELCNSVDEIQNDIIRECIRFSKNEDPLEIVHIADLPASIGLATSSSLIIALLKGLFYYRNVSVAPGVLFDYAYRVEREILNHKGGWQDYACVWGGFNYLVGSSQNIQRTPVSLEPDKVKELEDHLMLVYTGNQANSGDVLCEQLRLLKEGETINDTLKIKTLVKEIRSILSVPGFNPSDLMYPIRESWGLKKKLSPNMTTPQIEELEQKIYTIFPDAGLRLIGSGGGRGLLLVVSPPGVRDKIKEAVGPLKTEDVVFDMEGARVFKLWQ